jgi:hypothetical protein
VAISLLIRKWPGIVRSPPFVQGFQEWWTGENNPPASNEPGSVRSASPWKEAASERRPAEMMARDALAVWDEKQPQKGGPLRFDAEELRAGPDGLRSIGDPGFGADSETVSPSSSPALEEVGCAKAAAGRPQSDNGREQDDGVFTWAGGTLYLIHFLRASGVMRHFDIGLSGWALLDLLGRCLLDREFVRVSQDPLWQALARLDGRDPKVPPGAGFSPSHLYRAPECWLSRIGNRFHTPRAVSIPRLRDLASGRFSDCG